MWLNLPLAPMLTNSRGAIDRPVMPTWRARGSQPSSVTLRVAPSSAPRSVAERLERVVLVGRDAAADADHDGGLGERVEIVVARAGEHPDAAAVDASQSAHVGFDRDRARGAAR